MAVLHGHSMHAVSLVVLVPEVGVVLELGGGVGVQADVLRMCQSLQGGGMVVSLHQSDVLGPWRHVD